MSRLTKLDRMTHAEKEAAKKEFWEAADNQTFPPETVAIVMHVSLPWLQKKDVKVAAFHSLNLINDK